MAPKKCSQLKPCLKWAGHCIGRTDRMVQDRFPLQRVRLHNIHRREDWMKWFIEIADAWVPVGGLRFMTFGFGDNEDVCDVLDTTKIMMLFFVLSKHEQISMRRVSDYHYVWKFAAPEKLLKRCRLLQQQQQIIQILHLGNWKLRVQNKI